MFTQTLQIRMLTLLSLLSIPMAFFAQSITTPRAASPAASMTQTVGISTITVDYSRPSVNEREIWGRLVRYGWNVQGFGAGNEAPWRSGANENSVLTLSHDAIVEGKKVPAGSYGLFFVINEDNTGEVILSKNHRSWGSYWYDPAEDVMRADISIREHTFTERLTYDVTNISRTSGELVLNWEKKQFPVKIEFDVDAIVAANAAEELKGPTGFSWQGFNSAAAYLLQNNHNLEQALAWSETAVAQNNSFSTLRVKAGILTAMGKEAEGSKIMDEAIVDATEAEMNAYGYQLINAGNTKRAIEIMQMNTKRHPKSANAWDSLGEAYVMAKEKDKAVKSFKKSLSLNPAPNVKANSERYLKQLEG